MRFVSKVLAPSCLFAVVVSGLCLALPTAGAQEPSTPAEQSPDADTGTDTDTDSDSDTDADAGTDTGADTGTDTGTDTGADTDGPEIVLPPGEVAPEEPEAGSYRVEIDPLRGMQQGRMRREQKTTIGGYGELHLNMVKPEDESFSSRLDLHRFVLFFAHRFNDRFQFYSEVELEHAFVAESGGVAIPGSFQIEQAFIDWRLLKDTSEALYLRAGVILVPMGVINQWHEPPIFNGVERPQVDRVIIPTTWREGGVGIWGQPKEEVRYEFYVMGGLDANGFSGSSGLRGGRLKVTQAVLNGPAFVGRLEWEPILGMVLGVSPYFGLAGPRELAGVNVKVGGISGDWRVLRKGFESRALIAYFHVRDTDALRVIPPGETLPTSTVGSNLFGAYGELGYNVLYYVDTEMALVPFVRVDYYDTTFQESDPNFNLPAFVVPTIGLTYRPIPQVVFKFDYQYERPSSGAIANRWNVGMGYMF
ncbi:MAG: hypothetical protein JRG67_13015 [Deltaproteobacteria bacterium]|nr:hypothetical protein [Deltaproteobacteria bacterium]